MFVRASAFKSELYGSHTHLVMRERYGGQAWEQLCGNNFLIVETNHRDIFGDAQAFRLIAS